MPWVLDMAQPWPQCQEGPQPPKEPAHRPTGDPPAWLPWEHMSELETRVHVLTLKENEPHSLVPWPRAPGEPQRVGLCAGRGGQGDWLVGQ